MYAWGVAVVAGFWIVVGLLMASFFLIRIARPLEQVVEASERLGEECSPHIALAASHGAYPGRAGRASP